VGVERHALFILDERYRIPAHIGHNGWTAQDVTEICREAEVTDRAGGSYRHIATQRMRARGGFGR
jgi:hypothetical protein